MKNKKILLCMITYFLYNLTLFGDAVITFYFKPYPIMPNSDYCKEVVHALSQPGVLAEHCLNGILDRKSIIGVFATYGGFLNISNTLGQISFPYKHTQKAVSILITPHIVPIMMVGNTVHHWEIEPESPAAMFSIEQKNDAMDGTTYWETQQIDIPDTKKIPVQTIIIIAKPKHIYVPLGATPTAPNPSLILPPIYVKKGINHVADGLYLLNLKHLFSPVNYTSKTDAPHFVTQVITQP